MEERQWWFASKLQDTFRFSGYDNPSLLEDFLSDYEVSELIGKFLGPGDPKKLFFYCEITSDNDDTRTPSLSNRQLQVTSQPNKDILGKAVDNVCLYCLRRGLVTEVDMSLIDSEVYCGEIRHSALVDLSTLLSEAYLPLLHAREDWGACLPEERSGFLQTFDRLTSNVRDSAAHVLANERNLLQPSARLRESLTMVQTQHTGGRGLFANEVVLEQCEELVVEWMAFIEGVLIEALDDRLEDSFALPSPERQKAERRQVLLHSIVEQLKKRESTVIIATLAAGKSRLLKKWRTIDTQLTEAFNGSRDRVWYLSSLQPHFDMIQSTITVSHISNEVLPALFQSIRQMDGLSRLYASTGYIALLLKRVANLIASSCQRLINTETVSPKGGTPTLWQVVFNTSHPDSSVQSDPSSGLLSILNDIVKLHTTFKTLVYTIKDTLLHQAPYSKSTRKKQTLKHLKSVNKKSHSVPAGTIPTASAVPGTVSNDSNSTVEGFPNAQQPSITLNDVDSILESLFVLSDRASKLLSVIDQVKKLFALQNLVIGLPRASTKNKNRAEEDEEEKESGDESGEEEKKEKDEAIIEDGADISIAESVSNCIKGCMECFTNGCPQGSSDVFVIVGKEKTMFPLVYAKYTQLIEEFEDSLSDYLYDVFPTIKESTRGIDILQRFSVITDGNKSLSKAVLHCNVLMFRVYDKELDHIREHYDQHKESPPLLRERSKVGGAIEWGRSLLRRVQSPMETFRHIDGVMKTPESHHVCTLHNKLSTVLLQYEAVWLKQYKTMMDKTSSRWMSAPLLRLQDISGERMIKIVVNSDTGLLQLLGETRSLLRLGVPLSPSAQSLLSQEARVKLFNSRLQEVVGDLYSCVDKIDSRLKPLFEKLIEGVLRFFLPGWTTLTWSTLNIDAFLHQVETAVQLLRQTVNKSNETVQDRVYPVFDTIAKTCLIDREMLTSKPWDPDELFEVLSDSIDTEAANVIHSASSCKAALLEVVTMVTQAEESLQKSLEDHSNALSKSVDYIKIHKDFGSVKKDKKKVIQFTLPRVHEDQVLLVLGKFSKLLNRSVGAMVLHSHSLLCNLIAPLDKGSKDIPGPSSILSSTMGTSDASYSSQHTSHIHVREEGSGIIPGSDNLESEPDPFDKPPDKIQMDKLIQIEVKMRFLVPSVVLQPNISTIQSMTSKLLTAITSLLERVQPWVGVTELDEDEEKQLETVVDGLHRGYSRVKHVFKGLKPRFDVFVKTLEPYKLLWQDDLNTSYNEFMKTKPTSEQWQDKIKSLVQLENEVNSIPSSILIGPLSMLTRPLKSSFQALASNWKVQFISSFHKTASESLNLIIDDRESMFRTLSTQVRVGDLQGLRLVLELLLHVDDMFHHIDEMYLPVESIYGVLRSFNFILPRAESELVDGLRDKWTELSQLASHVKGVLLGSNRLVHEQETMKAVKEFVVETIQFRNAFDTEGPLVPGLIPVEAVSRVGAFLDQSDELQSKRSLLDTVQSLMCIPLTPYPELDHTQEELSYLKALYNNYQNFIAFDEQFHQTLWCEVNLYESLKTVNEFWEVFLSLPVEQQNWEASHKLRIGITNYRGILPLFKKLHGQEIRNRHWLQVMNVANCNFQLDSRIFRMEHLLDAELSKFSVEIEEIIVNASSEQKLEKQFMAIEEKWSEQVLQFQTHSQTSIPLLSQVYSLSLLEQLDSTQTELAIMLLSKHIHPLRNDCAQWAGKLGHIAEVLQVWLNVQELWLSLQPVLSDKGTAKDFPDEAVLFSDATVTWEGIMTNASMVKSCMQCCSSVDDPVLPTLFKLTTDLEHCKKSLSAYLMEKRLAFPRLFYIPDDGLLTLLSNADSVEFVTPYLRNLFGGISKITLSDDQPLTITVVESIEGEELPLARPVHLSNSVEQWLCALHSSSRLTIQQLLLQSMDSDLPSLEEIVLYHVTQVACVSLYQQWNKDCEAALSCCRYDRRALPGLRNRFNLSVVSKLNSLLMRNTWKHSEEIVTDLQRLRLENMMVLSLWLRDIIDDLCQRKLREPDDFEWRRFPRLIPYMSADGEQELVLHVLDVEMPYCNEYLGCQRIPVLTPRTDAYFISLTQSLSNGYSSCVILPPGASKTELIKGISYLIGQFVVTLDCTSMTQSMAIVNYFTGLAQDGSWGCLSNVHLLSITCVSVIASMMDTIATARLQRKDTAVLPHSREVPISPTSAMFITHSPSWTPPTFLSPLIRSFSVPYPDVHLYLRTHCMVYGFKGVRVLIGRLETFMTLVNNQLVLPDLDQRVSVYAMCRVLAIASKRIRAIHATPIHGPPVGSSTSKADVTKVTPGRTPQRDPKSQGKVSTAVPQPLPVGVVREHTIVGETISVLLGSRFSKQELPVFQSFLKDIFHDCPDVVPTSTSSLNTIKSRLETNAGRNGYTCYGYWIDKTEQLYLSLKTNHVTVVAGRESTGKSSSLKTVISTINSKADDDHDCLTVKLHTLYPGMFMSVSDMFGCYDDSDNWRDGIFTSLMRKSMKATQTSTWVSFDGVLAGEWTDHIGQMAVAKSLSLSNGEVLLMNTDTMKLVFETGDISTATPTLLTHSGIVYFDTADLSWRALASAWLNTRNHYESNCLERVFEAVIDQVVDFVLNKSEYGSRESEVALFESCLSYLSALLNMYTDTAEVFSDVHVERLALFSITWSYGAVLLSEKEKRRFSLLLRQLSNSLPDDDIDYSVFDYYVDESGEWDTWQTKLPESRCQGVDLFGDVFVETAATIRVEMLLELSLVSHKHVLLVGPQLSGKTLTLNHFLALRALNFTKSESTERVILNGSSTANDIHSFMQVHLKHRQGYTYGPEGNRCLHLMIDDVHVVKDGSITTHEYLRSIIDSNGMYNLVKKNQWCQMEDVLMYCTMSSNTGPDTLDTRLKRHFSVIPVESLNENDLADIIPIMLNCLIPPSTDGNHDNNGSFTISGEVLSRVTNASQDLFVKLKDTLTVSDTPGRYHYMFSLQHLGSALQGLSYYTECSDITNLSHLWNYEINRSFGSCICRHGDYNWLTTTVNQIAVDQITSTHNEHEGVRPLYSSISPSAQVTKETSKPMTSLSYMPDIKLHPLNSWAQLTDSVNHYIVRYQEEVWPSMRFDVDSNNAMILERLYRSMQHARGNCVLIGSRGLPLVPISQLALYIAGYTNHPIEDAPLLDYTGFTDVLRNVFRLAGLEGKQVGLILEESHLNVPGVLGVINSLVSTSYLPTLFSSDEMDGLYHALIPTLKRDFPSEQIDPEQYFAARICQNLRLVLCVTPGHPILTGQSSYMYPGIFRQCHMIWVPEWTPTYIHNTTSFYLDHAPLSLCLPQDHRDLILRLIPSIHSYILTQSGSMGQAGVQPFVNNQSSITGLTPHDYLLEKMCATLGGSGNVSRPLDVPYVGPTLLKDFMECLCLMYREKSGNLKEEGDRLRNGLNTLDSVSMLVSDMQSSLSSLKDQLAVASQQASSLLSQVTAKSCQLEGAKALCGQGGVVLSAMRMVSEQKRLMSENEENDFELLAAFYDRLPRKSSRVDSLIAKAKTQLEEAEEEESLTKAALVNYKEKARYWQSRIDRNTIDQIKNLPNPPALVGVVMELMLSLFKRYGIESAHAHSGGGAMDPTSPAITRKKISTHSANAKMEREQWVQLQLAIGDSQRFLDLVNSLKWEDGLHKDAIALIESKLATSRNSKHDDISSLPSTTDSVSSSTSQTGLISVSMAKYAAESAGAMCGFAVAIVEYQYAFEPYRLAHIKAEKLRKQLQALEQEEVLDLSLHQSKSLEAAHHGSHLSDVEEEEEWDVTEEDVRTLSTELQQLQDKFDTSMMEKHNLTSMCQELTLKLKLAKDLLEGLKPCQEVWSTKVNSLPSDQLLLVNCVVSSAMLVYGGSLLNEQRSNLFNVLSTLCEGHCTLSYDTLPSFLLSEDELHHLSMEQLPIDEHSLFNVCLVTNLYSPRWPLVIDAFGLVEQWMRKREESVVIPYKDYDEDDSLVSCLTEGKSLVLIDVDVSSIFQDQLLMELITNKSAIIRGKTPFKIKVKGNEIDCHRNFRLCLVTSDPSIPSSVLCSCTVVVFHPQSTGLETLILEEFLNTHNPKTFSDRYKLKEDIHSLIKQQASLENQLLVELNNEMRDDNGELELEQKIVNRLLTINKSYEFAVDNLNQVTRALAEMTYHSLSTLTMISKRASVIMECVYLMGERSPVYKSNYTYTLQVFKTFVKQAGSLIQSEDILSRLTKFSLSHFEKGYLETDRELFLVLTAIQLKISQGNMTFKEYDYLLIPTFGTCFNIKGLVNQPVVEHAPLMNFGKKPFDWMSEKQWQSLLMLASHFDWIHPLLQSMGKDSKEMVWRSLSEGTAPETVSLIEAIGRNKLTLSHQLLIRCVFRPERVSQFLLVFAAQVLNQKPLVPKQYEFKGVLNAALSGHTPLIIYDNSSSVLMVKLDHYARKTQVNLRILKLFGCETDEDISKLLQNVQQTLLEDPNEWVLLHDIHLSPSLLSQLTNLIHSFQEHCHDDGKCGKLWLSLDVKSLKYIPKQLLQRCFRVAIETPKSLISFLTQTLLTCGQMNIINQSPRSEWIPLIHSLAMNHIILTNRRGVCWWSVGGDYDWNQNMLMDMLRYVSKEFTISDAAAPGIGGFKPVSWSGIRYMHTEVVYGSLVTCSPDINLLSTLADHWLHPGGPKREPGLYHASSSFFVPNTRPNALIQSLELATPPLVPSSEIYGMHFTSEMELGNAKRMLQSLATMSSLMKKSIRYQPKESAAILNRGKSVESSSNSNPSRQPVKSSNSTRALEKLPSTIVCHYNLVEYHLESVSREVVWMVMEDEVFGGYVKSVLLNSVNKLVETFPSGWKKDLLMERLSKLKFDSPFTVFIMNETERLNTCLNTITTNLLHLQTALRSSTNEYLSVFMPLPQIVLSLLSLQVPDTWSRLVGVSSPPVKGWSLQEWLNDLALRYVFMDKVLSWGIERTPTYWLGAFFNPRRLLSTFFQTVACSSPDQLLLVADLTTRDKDHIRDPPQEGIFMYGIYLWGVHFEKSTNLDITDTPPKSINPSSLPIIHLTLRSSQTYVISNTTSENKAPYTYHAPCYPTRSHRGEEPLFHVKIVSNDIGTTKWSLRNLFCTLRPF